MKRIIIFIPALFLLFFSCNDEETLENISIESELILAEHNKAEFKITIANPDNLEI